ncbi:putative peptidase (DUF1758) domain-containing protein [Phthorimaea operculella]|nr:putative peptidase (DUF1758) domain-containing protein [Phthorimaea operculella]
MAKHEEVLSQLKNKRKSCKRKFTLFEKYINNLKDLESINDIQRGEISLRLANTESLLQEFESVQLEIESYLEEDEISDDELEQFQTRYYSIVALAKHLSQDDAESSKSSHHSSSSLKSLPKNNYANNAVKLPTISLPSFDGSVENWLEYRDTYLSLIHNNDMLGAIQKFHYLRSSLTGSALQVIKSLEFSETNYATAWELLEGRFNNKRLLIHNHVKALFAINNINKESPSNLRKLIDHILKNLRALEGLGEPTSHWDTLIIHIVTSKLDSVTEREWEQHKSSLLGDTSKSITLDQLIKFMKDRADMLDMINHSKKSLNITSPTPASSHHQVHSYFTTNIANNKNNASHKTNTKRYAQTHAPVRFNNKNFARSCPVCTGNHPLYSCSDFLRLSATERLKVLNDKHLCVNCMRTGHGADACWFGPCKQPNCDLKHNSLVHGAETSRDRAEKTIGENSTHTSLHSAYQGKITADKPGLPILKPSLLSTALVDVADSRNCLHTIRCVLDNGSQRCIVSESLIKKLDLNLIQSTHKITGVGQTVTSSSHICELKLHSKTSNFNTNLTCLVLPSITSDLSTSFDLHSIHIPDNIQLADPEFYRPDDVQLLIGVDKFWELINDGKIRLNKDGPYLVNTKLGWIVAGTAPSTKYTRINEVHCNFTQTSDAQMRMFWELEEIPKSVYITQKMNRHAKICS